MTFRHRVMWLMPTYATETAYHPEHQSPSLNCVAHLVVNTSGPFFIHDLLPGL